MLNSTFLFIFEYSLDELLDGGLYTGELTEIVGPAGVGKSQVRILKSLGKFKLHCTFCVDTAHHTKENKNIYVTGQN